jgi:hypothetical protein
MQNPALLSRFLIYEYKTAFSGAAMNKVRNNTRKKMFRCVGVDILIFL